MLWIAFWILVGAFIGWNFPQPSLARKFQESYLVPAWNWLKGKVPFI
jgi:hypothetical protein